MLRVEWAPTPEAAAPPEVAAPAAPSFEPEVGLHTVPRKGTGMIIGGSISLGLGVPLLIAAAPSWFTAERPGGAEGRRDFYDRFMAPFTIPGIIFTATGGALLGVGLYWRARWKQGDPIMDEYEYPTAPTLQASERLVRRARAKIISGSVLTGVFVPLTGFSIYVSLNTLSYGLVLLVPLAVSTPLLATGGVLLGKGLKERRAMGEAYYRVGMRAPARRWSPFVGGVGPLPGQPRVFTPTYGVNLQF